LKEGEQFGEYSFFTSLPRSCCAKSQEFSVLYKIDRTKFLNVVKECAEDYEKFCEIKDKISIYNKLEVIEN
jgi:CRP-like cAMP-binding protein